MSPRDLAPIEATSFAPATAPRDHAEVRMLIVDRTSGTARDAAIADLAHALEPGDVLVVNDAATIPASLSARTDDGATLEVRLAEAPRHGHARAVLFGAGDWRTKTEDRAPPAAVLEGAGLVLANELSARVVAVSEISPRLVTLRFEADQATIDHVLWRRGAPVQYAYLEAPLALWSIQTPYAGPPWSVEAPSAGLHLSWSTSSALRTRGVELLRITHAAGLSSTGDPAIDRALPLPERSFVPEETARAVMDARAHGGRVIAVGTSVVRALEGAAPSGTVLPGERVVDLVLSPHTPPRVVDGLLTGMHAPGESHHALLGAFLAAPVLERVTRHAAGRGYLAHEHGDTMLVLPRRG